MSAIVVVCAILAGAQQVSAQTLPSGWTGANINSSGGSAVSSNGTWVISGSGANIWDAVDGFQFTSRSISGDFEISARLSDFDPANDWSKVGLMVRESSAANAKNAFVMFSPGTGPALQYRAATGGTTARVTGSAAGVPMWLRLVRQGTRFTAYRSPDGSAWTSVGSATVSMESAVLAGLAVTSRDAGAIATATFNNVVVEAGAAAPATAEWASSDIGSPPVAGTFSIASGTFAIAGVGDVTGTADQFRFAYQAVEGDVEIIARLATFYGPDPWAKTGVMIRQSLDRGAPHGLMVETAQNGFAFQRRLAPGGTTYTSQGALFQGPAWLRLVREGNLLTAYSSYNGTTWTVVGTDTVAMSGTIYVGLAIASHSSTSVANATFTNVSVRTPAPGANQPPSVTLTAPTAGATYTAPATISFSASASDADGTISRVDFYRGTTLVGSDTASPFTASWTNVAGGSYAFTAVAYDSDGASATSPAVTVTVNGSGSQAPSVSFVSPLTGATFVAPASVRLEAAASDADGSISRVDFYQGSTLLKSDFTVPYSVYWSYAPAGSYQLTAVARDNSGLTTSATIAVTVTAAGNQTPTVAITSPATGAVFTAPATVNIQATASDADGSIARVEFYRGSTLIATDTASPFAATWSSAPAGTYALTARAYDNAGAAATSAPVNVSIATATNQLPTVSLTSPAAGAGFTAPASIAMAATAADADGTVAVVDFYVGTQLVGSDTSSPYTASWTNVPAGTYSLTAVARDNAGGTRTSAAVSIAVSATATRPTTVVFTPSPDHATLVTSYVIAIYRATDPETASPVATRDLGRPAPVSGSISVDITTLVTPLPVGNYYAIVRSVGAGGSTSSTPSPMFAR
jgi:regulation of enolase protein 1 (concanavalin A-like superfamily)